MKILFRILAATAALFITSAQAQQPGPLGAGEVFGNPTASSALGRSTKPWKLGINFNSFALDHTIATTDCNGTVQMGSGSTWPLTLTLPAVGSFTAPCPISIVGQTSRGVKLSGFSGLGLTSPNILWPQKSFAIDIANGAWVVTRTDGRWVKQNLTINVDTAGNDANDGLATGTTNAVQHLDQCRTIAQFYIDTQSGGNGGLTCLVPSGQSPKEFVQVFFPLVGGGTLIFQGSGGQFNWVPANSSYSVQFGDLGVVGFTNVNFTTSGSTTPQGLVLGHNYGVADFNTGITFTAASPAVSTAMDCDYDAHFNINNGFTYNGTFSTFLWRACQNSSWNFNNAIDNTGTSAIGKWFNIFSGAKVLIQGNVTFVTTGLTTAAGLVSGNAVLNNLSGSAPPGGAPTPTTGGQYCTTLC